MTVLAELRIERDPSGLARPLRLGCALWATCAVGQRVIITTDAHDVHAAELEHDQLTEEAYVRWHAAPSRYARRAVVRLPRCA